MFQVFYETQKVITVFTTVHHSSLSWATLIQSTPQLYLKPINIILPSTPRPVKRSPSFRFFCPIRAARPTHHPPWFGQHNNISLGVHISLSTKARVQFQDSACGICDGRSGNGVFFFRVLRFSPVSNILPTLHTYSFIFRQCYMILGIDNVIK
jgi:hypothetical protein